MLEKSLPQIPVLRPGLKVYLVIWSQFLDTAQRVQGPCCIAHEFVVRRQDHATAPLRLVTPPHRERRFDTLQMVREPQYLPGQPESPKHSLW